MPSYDPAPDMLAELAPLVQQYQAANAVQDTSLRDSVCAAYRTVLLRFLASGWVGAVGCEHELPDADMPQAYLATRAQILDRLEKELCRLAIEYRSALASPAMMSAVAAYHAVFDQMTRIGHWHGVPDPDSQLPLDDMPALFKAQRAERIRRFRTGEKVP